MNVTETVVDVAVNAVKKLTAKDLAEAIRARYEAPEWHIEPEVTLSGRRLDLVALNMWGARNYRIVGFEIKVSRGDWLRELNAFQKSEEWNAVVDAFYVVTPPKMIRDDELPERWGLLELTGSRMMTRRHAAVREGATTIPREIAARFITRLAHRDSQADRTAQYLASDQLRREARERAEKEIGPELEALRKTVREMDHEHRELYRALGLDPTSWRAHERAIRAAGLFAAATESAVAMRQRLDFNAQELERFAKEMRAASAALMSTIGTPTTTGD